MGLLRGAVLGAFLGLARGQGGSNGVVCTVTADVNAYPNVRRSGNSANGYQPSEWFLLTQPYTAYAAFPLATYYSDSSCKTPTESPSNYIDSCATIAIVRSTPVDPSQANIFGQGCVGYTESCKYSVSNATLGQYFKRDQMEVGDIVSFDVAFQSTAGASGDFDDALGELVAGSQIFVKLGCLTSACASWAGVGGADIFSAYDWIANTDQNVNSPSGGYNYDITAAYEPSPIALSGGANGGAHVTLTVGQAVSIDLKAEIALGAIIAVVTGPPESDAQFKFITTTTPSAFSVTDSRCSGAAGSNNGQANGETNGKFLVVAPTAAPTAAPSPPPVAGSPCTSDDDDSDGIGGNSDSGNDSANSNAGSNSGNGNSGSGSNSASDSGSGSNSASDPASDSGSGSNSASSDSGSGSSIGSSNGDSGSAQARRLDGGDDSNSAGGGGSNSGSGSDDGGDNDGSNSNGGGSSDDDDCDDDSSDGNGNGSDGNGNGSDGDSDDDANDGGNSGSGSNGASDDDGTSKDAASSADSGSGSASASASDSGSGSSIGSSDSSKDGGGSDDDSGSGGTPA